MGGNTSIALGEGGVKRKIPKQHFLFNSKEVIFPLSLALGNLMTLKFLSDASVTAGGFQIKYVAVDPPSKPNDEKNATSQGNTNFLSGKFGIM